MLHQLPALIVLDRLSAPVIAMRFDGITVYANPACARLFGHQSSAGLTGQSLPDLLVGDSSAQDCVSFLRSAQNSLSEWHHAKGHPIKALVTGSILQLAANTKPLLLVNISDITDYHIYDITD